MKPSIIAKFGTPVDAATHIADIKREAAEPETGVIVAIEETDTIVASLRVDGTGKPIYIPISSKDSAFVGTGSKVSPTFSIVSAGSATLDDMLDWPLVERDKMIASGFEFAKIDFVFSGIIVPATPITDNADLGYFVYQWTTGGRAGQDVGRSNLGATVGTPHIEQARQVTMIVKISEWDQHNKLIFDNQTGANIDITDPKTRLILASGIRLGN